MCVTDSLTLREQKVSDNNFVMTKQNTGRQGFEALKSQTLSAFFGHGQLCFSVCLEKPMNVPKEHMTVKCDGKDHGE